MWRAGTCHWRIERIVYLSSWAFRSCTNLSIKANGYQTSTTRPAIFATTLPKDVLPRHNYPNLNQTSPFIPPTTPPKSPPLNPHPSHPVPNPTPQTIPSPTTPPIPAPTATSTPALTYPHPIKISSAATLFTLTAHDTAVAALGRSYSQIIRRIGNSFVQELTSRAVLRGVGCG